MPTTFQSQRGPRGFQGNLGGRGCQGETGPQGKANPAGGPGEIQYNASGSFGAQPELHWDSVNHVITVKGTIRTENASAGTVDMWGRGGALDNILGIQGSFIPVEDDTYTLGSSLLRWQELFIGPASIHIGTDGDEGIIRFFNGDIQGLVDSTWRSMTADDAALISYSGTAVAGAQNLQDAIDSLTVQNVAQEQEPTHGFVAGDVVGYDGTNWFKAQANSRTKAEVVGIVANVIDSNEFHVVVNGYVEGLSQYSFDAGMVYYLSPSTPGGMVAGDQSSFNQVSKPLLVATGVQQGYVVNWRGFQKDSSPFEIERGFQGSVGVQGPAIDTASGVQYIGPAGVGNQSVQYALDDLYNVSSYTSVVFVSSSSTATEEDGSIGRPYTTIQKAIDHFGDPAHSVDFQKRCLIFVLDNGRYVENLTIPHRSIAIMGSGLVIDGSITREIDNNLSFGVSTSTFRSNFALIAQNNLSALDENLSHQQGINITGNITTHTNAPGGGNIVHHTILSGVELDGDYLVNNDNNPPSSYGSIGNHILHIHNSRLNGDLTAQTDDTSTITLQRLTNSVIVGASELDYWVSSENSEIQGDIKILHGFGDSPGTDVVDTFINTRFTTGTQALLNGPQAPKMDATTAKSWYQNITPDNQIVETLLDGAQGVSYNNAFSGLSSANVQLAIDEIADAISGGTFGTQGYQGYQGYQGDQGNQGVAGTGFQGNRGVQGPQGYQGLAGIGNQGARGFQGDQGNQGYQGSQGYQGGQGYQGAGNGWVDDGSTIRLLLASDIVSIGSATAPSAFKLGVQGHIGPQVDDTYDLGSPSFRWRNVYVGPQNLYVGNVKISGDTGFQMSSAGNSEFEYGTRIIPPTGGTNNIALAIGKSNPAFGDYAIYSTTTNTYGIYTKLTTTSNANRIAMNTEHIVSHSSTTVGSGSYTGSSIKLAYESTASNSGGVLRGIDLQCGWDDLATGATITGSLSKIIGLQAIVGTAGSATTTGTLDATTVSMLELYAYNMYGNTNTLNGVYLGVFGSAWTPVNSYAIYIPNTWPAGSTNNYSIYSATTADSYFAGGMLIGTTSGEGMLNVRADSATNTAGDETYMLYIGTDSATTITGYASGIFISEVNTDDEARGMVIVNITTTSATATHDAYGMYIGGIEANAGEAVGIYIPTTALTSTTGSTYAIKSDTSSPAKFSGDIYSTGFSTDDGTTVWDSLGGYTATAPSATGYISIDIDGTTYKLLASNV